MSLSLQSSTKGTYALPPTREEPSPSTCTNRARNFCAKLCRTITKCFSSCGKSCSAPHRLAGTHTYSHFTSMADSVGYEMNDEDPTLTSMADSADYEMSDKDLTPVSSPEPLSPAPSVVVAIAAPPAPTPAMVPPISDAEHGAALRRELTPGVREELRRELTPEVREELRRELTSGVRAQLRRENADDVKEKLMEYFTPKVKAQLIVELTPGVKAELKVVLASGVRSQQEVQVRAVSRAAYVGDLHDRLTEDDLFPAAGATSVKI